MLVRWQIWCRVMSRGSMGTDAVKPMLTGNKWPLCFGFNCNQWSNQLCAHFTRILLSTIIGTSFASIKFGTFAKPFVSSLDAVIPQLFSDSSNAKQKKILVENKNIWKKIMNFIFIQFWTNGNFPWIVNTHQHHLVIYH